MPLWRVDDAQVRDALTGQLLTALAGAQVQIVLRDTTTPAAILDSAGDTIADALLTVTPVLTAPRFWIDTEDPAGLYLDWYDAASGARGPVEFEAVLRDAALGARTAATASEAAATAAQNAAADSAAEAAAAAIAPTVEMVEPLVDAAVTEAFQGAPDTYALVGNAQRDPTFGDPQHEDGAIYTYPNLLDFGPVNEPPPVVTRGASRGLDIVAHWYNDFGLYKEALAANQAAGAYLWYDWRWNFPTNTGNGDTSYGYDPQRHPLQGFYKGDDPRVLGWQCKWLAEAGVDAVSLVQTDGFKRVSASGVDWSNPASSAYWIYRLFNETPNFAALRWVAWLDSSGTTADITAQIDEVIWLWQTYPNGYTYTENGKTYAVVFLWDGELLRGAFDNYLYANATQAHLRNVATKFRALGYDGVYVMARNGGLVSTNYNTYDLYEDGVLYGVAEYSGTYAPPAGDSYNNDFSQYAAKAVFPVPSQATGGYRTLGVVTAAESVYPHPSNFNIAGTTPAAFGLVLRRAADHIAKYDMPRILAVGNVSEWAESGPGLIPNVYDGFGYLDQVRALPSYTGTRSGTAPDVQVFTGDGTWLKPRGATTVEVMLVAGGGGGCSGAVGAAGAATLGGAGGGGGGRTMAQLPASSLAGSVAVTVGAGGTGGPAQTSATSTPAVDGTSGGDTTFGVLKAFGGGRGQATAGGGGGGGTSGGSTGGNSSATGGAGTSNTTSSGFGPSGGGGGGGITSANVAGSGGYGGSQNMVIPANSNLATTTGANGVTRFDAATDSGLPGGGGSGGGASTTANGGDGGAGGKYGGGGGGGAATRSGFTSGAGGAGGAGIAIVVTYF